MIGYSILRLGLFGNLCMRTIGIHSLLGERQQRTQFSFHLFVYLSIVNWNKKLLLGVLTFCGNIVICIGSIRIFLINCVIRTFLAVWHRGMILISPNLMWPVTWRNEGGLYLQSSSLQSDSRNTSLVLTHNVPGGQMVGKTCCSQVRNLTKFGGPQKENLPNL